MWNMSRNPTTTTPNPEPQTESPPPTPEHYQGVDEGKPNLSSLVLSFQAKLFPALFAGESVEVEVSPLIAHILMLGVRILAVSTTVGARFS
ncbi:hypothetical protein L2E82_06032 [Cichorium intybus]|uniref:Uncharacterized protein n=1 Tax=Cichorium intybus TaxID=13427 RepID=A0ACB9HA94_CICIN|nr:hypothetical protein L2E82_06032 [Cichorium intybus]